MSVETNIPGPLPTTDVDLLKQWIDEQSHVDAPQTRKEVKDALSPQERDDRKRAGKLVIKVLNEDPLLGQIIPVDGKFSRGRTSPIAARLAQDNLLAHGIVTEYGLEEPAANDSYEVERDGDRLQPYGVLRVNGIEDRANLSAPKHASRPRN